ncbi:hydrolase [Streptomyces sp. RFCAC02]|uniref:hydrolase n=1 Tax=Streptomyces sp. RFCAC02 TaxID=2499143 RepID=UPI001F0F75EA|nr:hydrolase [Streptomyces sp. RFCAC02]
MHPSRALPRSWRVPAALTAALALVAAGAAASASAAPTAACTADGFCEDFESQTGTQPAGRWATEFPDCSGTGTAAIDSAVAHDGTRSVRVDGGLGYCNHVFVGTDLDDVPAASDLYVRFWVRHTTDLPTQHVTFLAMEDAADQSRDLRMGGQNGMLQWNRESDDATLPEQSPAGVALSVPLPTDTWSCVEFHVDASAGLLDTWVDGTAVTGLTVDGTPTHDIDGQWLNRTWRPDLTDLRLGWESYGQGTDTLWYDDIAVGTTRTGC